MASIDRGGAAREGEVADLVDHPERLGRASVRAPRRAPGRRSRWSAPLVADLVVAGARAPRARAPRRARACRARRRSCCRRGRASPSPRRCRASAPIAASSAPMSLRCSFCSFGQHASAPPMWRQSAAVHASCMNSSSSTAASSGSATPRYRSAQILTSESLVNTFSLSSSSKCSGLTGAPRPPRISAPSVPGKCFRGHPARRAPPPTRAAAAARAAPPWYADKVLA